VASNSSIVTLVIFFNKKIGNFFWVICFIWCLNSNDFSNYFGKKIGKSFVSKNLGKKKTTTTPPASYFLVVTRRALRFSDHLEALSLARSPHDLL
jgi:hypothetical protein